MPACCTFQLKIYGTFYVPILIYLVLLPHRNIYFFLTYNILSFLWAFIGQRFLLVSNRSWFCLARAKKEFIRRIQGSVESQKENLIVRSQKEGPRKIQRCEQEQKNSQWGVCIWAVSSPILFTLYGTLFKIHIPRWKNWNSQSWVTSSHRGHKGSIL